MLPTSAFVPVGSFVLGPIHFFIALGFLAVPWFGSWSVSVSVHVDVDVQQPLCFVIVAILTCNPVKAAPH